jgi:hypothetical protein
VFWWWWEFRLGDVGVWTFQLYLFVVLYAVLMFLTASILFPDSLEEFDGYRDYFYSRRVWLFCLLGVIGLTDVADSLAKGVDYWLALGHGVPNRTRDSADPVHRRDGFPEPAFSRRLCCRYAHLPGVLGAAI